MFKYLVPLVLGFSLSSCASSSLQVKEVPTVKANKKVFKLEDYYILVALQAEYSGSLDLAIELYGNLYAKSEREEYLYRSFKCSLEAKKYGFVIERADFLELKDNPILLRYKIVDLIGLKEYTKALGLAKNLVSQTEEENDYILLTTIYSSMKNLDEMLNIYLKMYTKFEQERIANKIVEIYLYTKELDKLIAFLELSKVDKKLLLDLYINLQNFDKAYFLADELYKETQNISYLGQSVIYQYERAKNKNSEELLNTIIKKLKIVVKEKKTGVYLNYLGYLLIDHNINIKEGISYVEDALKVEPDSAFYLDSLAWGYFKLGNCKNAKKIMDKVVTLEGGDNEEVIEHINSIDRCLQN